MNLRPELFVVGVMICWLLVLTILFIRFYFFYSRLNRKGKKESLIAVIDAVLDAEKANKKAIEQLSKQYDTLVNEVSFHIQKVGMLRFNPFNDTGGDQSFVVALLDAHDTGIIISSYHTRSGTRWYAKNVKKGKGIEHELSVDEQKAMQGAKVIR